MISRKVLFTFFDDSFMYEDLPLFIKKTARKVIVSKFKFFYFEVDGMKHSDRLRDWNSCRKVTDSIKGNGHRSYINFVEKVLATKQQR